jgi:hypothetical protein
VAILARDKRLKGVILPRDNASEARRYTGNTMGRGLFDQSGQPPF